MLGGDPFVKCRQRNCCEVLSKDTYFIIDEICEIQWHWSSWCNGRGVCTKQKALKAVGEGLSEAAHVATQTVGLNGGRGSCVG